MPQTRVWLPAKSSQWPSPKRSSCSGTPPRGVISPWPIVTLHGRRQPRHHRQLPPARPDHLGGCGAAHRRWCGGSAGAAAHGHADPDVDCDRLRFARARRPKPHARRPEPHARRPEPHTRRPEPHTRRPKPDAKRPKPHARRHQPGPHATGDAQCNDSCIAHPDRSTTGHAFGVPDTGRQPNVRVRPDREPSTPTTGYATGQLGRSRSAQLGPDRPRRLGPGQLCAAAPGPEGRGVRSRSRRQLRREVVPNRPPTYWCCWRRPGRR